MSGDSVHIPAAVSRTYESINKKNIYAYIVYLFINDFFYASAYDK